MANYCFTAWRSSGEAQPESPCSVHRGETQGGARLLCTAALAEFSCGRSDDSGGNAPWPRPWGPSPARLPSWRPGSSQASGSAGLGSPIFSSEASGANGQRQHPSQLCGRPGQAGRPSHAALSLLLCDSRHLNCFRSRYRSSFSSTGLPISLEPRVPRSVPFLHPSYLRFCLFLSSIGIF